MRVAGRTLYAAAEGIDLTPQQRRLAYVFQDYALFPRRLQNAGIDRWIATFGLQAVADHYPHQISGGQRQRTALARALMNEPTALLLDEPFAALDKGLRQRLRDDLAALQRALDIPLLLITHDDDDVRALADAVVHLRDGRVQPHPTGVDPQDGLQMQVQA